MITYFNNWAQNFDTEKHLFIFNDYQQYFWLSAVIYIIVIFGIKFTISKNLTLFFRKYLKYPFVCWNLFLALFSIFGSIYTIPPLLALTYNNGFKNSICSAEYTRQIGPAMAWTFLFMLSKIPEFIDTLFIILRGSNLIFLHWYHHIATMLFCWYAGRDFLSFGPWFTCMNLFVHSIMYSYYFLTALEYKFKNTAWITILQILQMCGGVLISVMYAQCENHDKIGVYAALLMYASYAFLFCKFFVDKFTKKHKN